jgi:glutamate-1-semialdehyde 2,1-aminomutase
MPNMDLVRMVNSGTEATMSAIRLARGYTGRDLIVKFEGCYHGHSDSLLIKAGSGALTLGVPSSPGVPAALADYTMTLTYNDTQGLRDAFAEHGERIACLIVEPVTGNMNCVLPDPAFLTAMREVCNASGAVLILDEVMTGFRFGTHGAQGHLGIEADLTCLGKVVGGGMPVGASAASARSWNRSPPWARVPGRHPVGQSDCHGRGPGDHGHHLATRLLRALFEHTRQLCEGMQRGADAAGVPFTTNHAGTMFGGFFTERDTVTNYADVMACDTDAFARFFHTCWTSGYTWHRRPTRRASCQRHTRTRYRADRRGRRHGIRSPLGGHVSDEGDP